LPPAATSRVPCVAAGGQPSVVHYREWAVPPITQSTSYNVVSIESKK
jgi:hypothetical protein